MRPIFWPLAHGLLSMLSKGAQKKQSWVLPVHQTMLSEKSLARHGTEWRANHTKLGEMGSEGKGIQKLRDGIWAVISVDLGTDFLQNQACCHDTALTGSEDRHDP